MHSTILAADYPVHQAAAKGDLKLLQKLLIGVAKVDIRNEDGQTPLMLAAQGGHAEAVTFLLDRGANLKSRSDFGSHVICFAAESGNLKTLQIIMERGADVNSANEGGGSPLIFAAQSGNMELAKFLIQKGANANLMTGQRVRSISPIYAALVSGKPEMVELIAARGVDVELRDPDGNTVLMAISKHPYPAAVRWLIKRGADVNARMPSRGPSDGGHTALHYAAYQGREETVKLLLAAGADPTLEAAESRSNVFTAEKLAVEQGHTTIAALIQEAAKRWKAMKQKEPAK